MSALAAFTFLRPLVLLALLPLGRALAPAAPPATAAEAPAAPHIAPHLLAALTIGRDGRRRLRAPDLLIGAAMLMTLAAAGPAWRPAPSPFVTETAPARHRPRPLAEHDRNRRRARRGSSAPSRRSAT